MTLVLTVVERVLCDEGEPPIVEMRAMLQSLVESIAEWVARKDQDLDVELGEISSSLGLNLPPCFTRKCPGFSLFFNMSVPRRRSGCEEIARFSLKICLTVDASQAHVECVSMCFWLQTALARNAASAHVDAHLK